MFNEILLLSLSLNATPDTPVDTTTYKKVDLGEVVVTDYKQNRRNLTTTAMSRVDSRLLQDQQVVSIKELSAVVPNFFMPDYGSRANTPVYIRGIGAKSVGSAVGFYVDGVPHYESSAFDIDLSDIAAIDVLRGPQGTLYGRNAIAGIINVYTHNPLEYQNTRVKVGYGKYNDVTAQMSNYTKLNPHFGFSVAGSYHHNDGMFYNAYLKDKADDIDEGEGRIGLYWKPTDRWHLRLNSTLSYSDQGGYPYAPYNVEKNRLEDINYNRYSLFRRLISSTGFNARYTNDRISFNSQSCFQYIKSHQAIDQDFTIEDKLFVENNYHERMYSQEFTLKSNNDSRYQWITGLFGMTMQVDQFIQNNAFSAGTATPTDNVNPKSSLAFYHQSSYNIWRGLSATAGVRFDYEHSKSDYHREKLNLGTGASSPMLDFHSTANFRQFTPKFTLQYLTTHRFLYYASITRGYKPGGFNESAKEANERSYDPEYSWNYEVGARTVFLNGRLTAEFDIFYIDWRDMQATYTILGQGNLITNAAHANSKGAELAVAYRPLKGLLFNLNYGYTYATYLDYKKSEKQDYTGNRLPMVPNHTLATNGSYTLEPAGWLDRVTISAGMTGLGRIYWADDNVVSQNFYATVNAKVSLTKGIVTWDFWGKNLTDTRYMAYGFKSSKGNYAQKGKPLTFGTSVSVNF